MVRATDALLLDIREWGVILEDDARERYEDEVVRGLLDDQLLARLDSAFGQVLYLDARGRQRVGFSGPYYRPVPTAVLNALALRDARTVLEQQGETEFVPRLHGKHLFTLFRSIATHRRSYAVAARYTGFDVRSVRSLYQKLMTASERPNGLYIFVPTEDVPALEMRLIPRRGQPGMLIKHHVLRLFALPRPRPRLDDPDGVLARAAELN